MTGAFTDMVDDYVALRRGLGYQLIGQSRYLHNFAAFLDRAGHHGPVPLAPSVDWATSTSSTDPCTRARRLSELRGFLRHLAVLDGATEVPPPGLLGPTGHRKPPHVYSEREITDLLRAAAALTPAGGLRPHCYVTLFSLLACTGLRISEALALAGDDVDLVNGVLTVRAGKGGRTRLVPCIPAPWSRWSPTPPGENNAAAGARIPSSAPTTATICATKRSAAPSGGSVANSAGPPRAAPGHHAFTICAIGWLSGVCSPGTPKAPTSTARSRYWRPTWVTSWSPTSTGTSPPCPN